MAAAARTLDGVLDARSNAAWLSHVAQGRHPTPAAAAEADRRAGAARAAADNEAAAFSNASPANARTLWAADHVWSFIIELLLSNILQLSLGLLVAMRFVFHTEDFRKNAGYTPCHAASTSTLLSVGALVIAAYAYVNPLRWFGYVDLLVPSLMKSRNIIHLLYLPFVSLLTTFTMVAYLFFFLHLKTLGLEVLGYTGFSFSFMMSWYLQLMSDVSSRTEDQLPDALPLRRSAVDAALNNLFYALGLFFAAPCLLVRSWSIVGRKHQMVLPMQAVIVASFATAILHCSVSSTELRLNLAFLFHLLSAVFLQFYMYFDILKVLLLAEPEARAAAQAKMAQLPRPAGAAPAPAAAPVFAAPIAAPDGAALAPVPDGAALAPGPEGAALAPGPDGSAPAP